MPDENGNLIPGDEFYIAQEPPVEEPIVNIPPVIEDAPVPEPDPIVEEEPVIVDESDVVIDETPVSNEVLAKPGHENIHGYPFYSGSPVVNPDNALLHFEETDVNKENR